MLFFVFLQSNLCFPAKKKKTINFFVLILHFLSSHTIYKLYMFYSRICHFFTSTHKQPSGIYFPKGCHTFQSTYLKYSTPDSNTLHILLTIDINCYRTSPSLGMCHLTKHSSVRACDSLDRAVRSIDIPLFIHGNTALRITILGCYLSICKEFCKPFLVSDKTSLSMRCRIGIYSAKLCFLQAMEIYL